MPQIWDLRELLARHPIDQDLVGGYCNTARVCFSEYHHPPTELTVRCPPDETHKHTFQWILPTPQVCASHANRIDAAEFGGYAIALACVLIHYGLVAFERAPEESGADWMLAPEGVIAFEPDGRPNPDAVVGPILRLEVAGRSDSSLGWLTKQKRKQLEEGKGKENGFAAVVAFRQREVRFSTTLTPQGLAA